MKLKRKFAWKEAFWIGIVIVILLYFWNKPFLYPFKMFVVLMHEISHGLAAILTGGSLIQITLSPTEGGTALTNGGNKLLVVSTGYIGSFIWGLLLLSFSKLRKISKWALGILAVFLLTMTILYVRTLFALIYGVLFGIALLILAMMLPVSMSSFFLKILGILTCLYVVLDIKSDLFFNKGVNDAIILAEITGIPAMIWSILWSFIVLLLIWFFILNKWVKKEEYDIDEY